MSESVVHVGDRVRLHLDSLAAGGEAVGRYGGMAVFARWGCPGDEAEVEITEVAARFARGAVVEVVTPSPDRVTPPCGEAGNCGGCQLQHIAYPAQLHYKAAIIRDTLTRIGGFEGIEIGGMWGMDDPWHYRNRAEYHARLDESGGLVLGFLRHRSHEVVPGDACRLNHPLVERLREATERAMARVAQSPEERADFLRLDAFVSVAREEALPTFVCRGRPPYLAALAEAVAEGVPEVIGVAAARSRGPTIAHRSPAEKLLGKSRLIEYLGEGGYQVSPDSFFQVNPAQATRLLALVEEWAGVTREDTIIYAYCGVGAFLLPLARRSGPAVGLESDDAAITDARLNIAHWRLRNVRLQRGKVETVLPRLAREGARADVIVLDPPRRGAGPVAATAAARLAPKRIILVSCDAATMARDLKTLAEHGYPPRRVQPIDMFPHTAHIEAVALCARGG
jgi:23S rRNA (uracil1939-C5)-methyltransferase